MSVIFSEKHIMLYLVQYQYHAVILSSPKEQKTINAVRLGRTCLQMKWTVWVLYEDFLLS